jgi:hypothetical protein
VKKLLSILTAMALGLYALTFAIAQVNVVPSPGLITAYLRAPTYSASSVALVPAASATDFWCLNGSTSKTISIREIIISGTAGTAITTPILVNLNHSLDTIGTPATGLALPVAAMYNTSNAAATATPTAWTANGTVNDATPNLLTVLTPTFQATTTANIQTIEYFGTSVDNFNQGLDILKAATVVQQICLNLNGKSVSSGVLNITVVWTES